MFMHPATALIHFGLGPRPDQPLPSDPRAWLLAQLDGPGNPAYPDGLLDTAGALAAERQRNLLRKQLKNVIPKGQDPVAQATEADLRAEAAVWVGAADSFREHLVLFWSNHFTTSRRNGNTQALLGPFVREAIRPNISGNFPDLLLAVVRHPAMLAYLNNENSVGPNSPRGLKTHQGLNENLARECMELHTLSPAAGYTQQDVTAMARILTGWSVKRDGPDAGFLYRRFAHEPGEHVVMRHRFAEGEQGGIDALQFLALHPATARHISFKLARHFVADNPPSALVAALTARYRDTGGNLPAMMRVLIDYPAAWPVPGQGVRKLRTPIEYIAASHRALGFDASQAQRLVNQTRWLEQPIWGAPSPKGWPDTAADWLDPAMLLKRVEFAYVNAAVGTPHANVDALPELALGPYVAPATIQAMGAAGSRPEAVALLLSSPEFWRR